MTMRKTSTRLMRFRLKVPSVVIERHSYERRTEAIIREAQLDGFYMLRTSEPADRLPTAAVVRR